MAVIIIGEPTTPNGSQSTILYSLANLSTGSQAKFICDVVDADSSVQLARLKQPANRNGYGVFEISDILHDYMDYDEVWKTQTPVTSSNSNCKVFSIQFGEEYSLAPNTTPVVFPNQISSSLVIYPAVTDPIDGYNFDSSSYYNEYLTNSPSVLYARTEDYGTLSHFNLNDSFLGSYVVTIYNQSNSVLATKTFTNTYSGSYSVSSNARLVHYPAGPQNFINDGTLGSVFSANQWSYYTLVGNTNQGTRRVNRLDNCISENGTRFAFINRLGVWDYYTATLTKTESETYQEDTYQQTFVDFSTTDGSVTFDKSRRGTTIYNKSITSNYSAQTDWLTQDESDWLVELFESPSVYVQYANGFIPVIITNNQVTKKTNPKGQKLFTYNITYTLANQKKSRR